MQLLKEGFCIYDISKREFFRRLENAQRVFFPSKTGIGGRV